MDETTSSPPSGASEFKPTRAAMLGVGLLSLAVLALWIFPSLWYTRSDPDKGYHWFEEQTRISGWNFEERPIAEGAERLLVADQLVNGRYTNAMGREVTTFSAKRYVEKPNDIGLFVHTPDRCWTEGGWILEPVAPDWIDLDIHGIQMTLERRVFTAGGRRELVYFGGLVGGQPLPYRLDHNMSVGYQHAMRAARDRTGTTLRASDKRFWQRVWDSFANRRQLYGPKQFVRISTQVVGGDMAAADQQLQEFIPLWLKPVDFRAELDRMASALKQPAKANP